MISNVIKRDGSRESFDPEKIKKAIRAAAQRTEVAGDRLEEVVTEVTNSVLAREKEEIASSEIKEKVLSELDTLEPSISEAWRQYDIEQGKA